MLSRAVVPTPTQRPDLSSEVTPPVKVVFVVRPLEPLTVKKNPVVNPLTEIGSGLVTFSSLNGEPFGIYKSNTTAVPIPIPTPFALEIFEQIPTPVTIPKSP